MKCPRLITAAVAFFVFSTASAQLNVKLPSLKNASPIANTAFRNDIQKVVEEYPHQYASLRGNVINKNPQSIEYASRIKPEGAQEATVVEYSALGKQVYTWQATMLVTEDYEEAAKKYKWLYSQ